MPSSVQIYCPTDPTFPVTLASGGRYFSDTHGNPWIMIGDTAFGLIGKLGTTWQTDVDTYLNTRAAQGFNCIYLNYIFGLYDDTSGRSDWATPDLVTPFLKTGGAAPVIGTDPLPGSYDISQLNPTYLARLDYIVNKASSLGIYLLINPADASVVDTPDNSGWIGGQGTTRCTAYGTALGNRYRNNQNVGWQWGNDYGFSGHTWGIDTYLGAIASAIRAAAPNQLQSMELNFNTSTGYDNTNWGPGRTYPLNWDTVYDYSIIYDHTYKAYQGLASQSTTWATNNTGAATGYPTTPVYFVEGVYERAVFDVLGQNRPIPTSLVRMVFYYPLCSGAIGGLYGNGVVFPFTSGWPTALNDPGAIHVGYAGQLFRSGPWHRLVPDGPTASFVTTQNAAAGTPGSNYVSSSTTGLTGSTWAAGAVTALGDFGIVYTPVNQALTINMSKMQGATTCQWFDPTNGSYISAATGTVANTGSHTFTPPLTNSTGDTDWVLVLRAPTATGLPMATSVHSSGHYMLDQFGHPMIMAGASDQSFQNMATSDFPLYFSTRASQGFNWAQTIIVGSIAEDLLTFTPDFSDVAGNVPWYQSDGVTLGTGPGTASVKTGQYDVTQPNAPYWARIDTLFSLARTYGITLLVEILASGVYGAGSPNWFFADQGTTKLAIFATWFANRYKSYTYHYLWGFDHFRSIPNGWSGVDPYLIAMINASRAANPAALHTIENEDGLWTTGATSGSALDLPGDDTAFTMGGGGPASLDLNWCYTAEDNCPDILRGYNQNFPTFFGEGKYENAPNNYPAGKNNWSNLLSRKYCYYPMVNGACGTYYGHDNVWHFGSGWQGQLSTTAVTHVGIWRTFMDSYPWWLLVPDTANTFVTTGFPTTGFPYPTRFGLNGSVTTDGSFGMVYLAANQSVTINLARMRGPTRARWFDPTNGYYTAITGSPFTASGTHIFTTSTNNAAGDPDWVLVLTA